MRMYAFPELPGGHTFIISSMFCTWKLAENQSRASRSLGSRRSSYSLNIKLTCSFVTWPMFPPYGLDIDKIFEGLTVPFACFFKRNLFTTSAVNPPADIRLPATNAAVLMQNGHIGSSIGRIAVHRERV